MYLQGKTFVPGDKSISHRAVILGTLAKGKTVVNNLLCGEDCMSTVSCMRMLGAAVSIEEIFCGDAKSCKAEIFGRGVRGLKKPTCVLQAGNSATTMRLLLGVLAGQKFDSIITGDDSLKKRPMNRVVKPLQLMGAEITAANNNNNAPVRVSGLIRESLHGINYCTVTASAQVKSALLLAGLYADGQTVVTEPYRSRDHTERMLKYFGADINCSGCRTQIMALNSGLFKSELIARSIDVPGDISSAAFFMAAAVVLTGSDICIKRTGINPTRTGFVDVLKEMGADITIDNMCLNTFEPYADVHIKYSELKAVNVDRETVPRLIDEIPALALVSVFAEGTTIINGVGELKYKETDRLSALTASLGALGAKIRHDDDCLMITGTGKLHGGIFDSHNDHRLAMTGYIAALTAEGKVLVTCTESIGISFPGFFELLSQLIV